MGVIIAFNKYGIKLDKYKNDYIPVDKTLLASEKYKQLKKGVDITITEKSHSGFVTDFKINNMSESSIHIPTRNDDILRSQCITLAFEQAIHRGWDISDTDTLHKIYESALVMYKYLQLQRWD